MAEKKKTGRPRKEVDYKLLENLASIGCTDKEIAIQLGISEQTFHSRKKTDDVFLEHYKRGWATIRGSLRRWQLAAAKKGSTAMLIWLGKQMLGQREHPISEDPEDRVTVTFGIGNKTVTVGAKKDKETE